MAKKKKFYKKKLTKEAPKKLPRNYRIITEKIINDHTVFFVGLACIIVAIVIVSYEFYFNFKAQEVISSKRQEIVKNLDYWNREVIEKPDYRDGYFSLALIYYQLGDYKNSLDNVDKAMNLDPNFEKGKELRKILEEK